MKSSGNLWIFRRTKIGVVIFHNRIIAVKNEDLFSYFWGSKDRYRCRKDLVLEQKFFDIKLIFWCDPNQTWNGKSYHHRQADYGLGAYEKFHLASIPPKVFWTQPKVNYVDTILTNSFIFVPSILFSGTAFLRPLKEIRYIFFPRHLYKRPKEITRGWSYWCILGYSTHQEFVK